MPPGKSEIYLGVDPGIADTGYGVISQANGKLQVLDYGSIKTDKKLPIPERLKILEQSLSDIIKKYHPECAGVEKLFFCNNAKTAMDVGQARGVIILSLAKYNLPIIELTPLQVKQAVTGYGKADKKQVQQMVKTILNLKTIPQPDDAADALAIAICASSCRKFTNY